MADTDLRSFATRTEAVLEYAPPSTTAETRTLVVEVLLQSLGWSVRGPACAVDRTLEEATLEYVCRLEEMPALFVAVEPYEAGLDDRRAERLANAMERTRVDRAIYTDGRRVVLLAGTDSIDRHRCELLAEETLELLAEHYGRRALSERFDGNSRAAAARRLALERSVTKAEIVDELASVIGDEHGRELELAVDRFLDGLVDAFATGECPQARSMGAEQPDTTPDPGREPEVERSPDSERHAQAEAGPGAADAYEEAMGARCLAEAVDAPTETTAERTDDGEFVVRFFGDRGSIGAIGHSNSKDALVQATEFLLERGLSGVELPWEVEGEVVLAGEGLEGACRQLSNGWYLNTAGNREVLAERVEGLASRAGLRAMLRGDWGLED